MIRRDEACIPGSAGLGGVDGTYVRYWDENSTIAMLEFKVEEPVAQSAPAGQEKKEKKPKLRGIVMTPSSQ